MTTDAGRRPVRRSQEQRRALSRARIAEATVVSLAAYGCAGTTIAGVAEVAGVSRGLMLHYYPQKDDLIVGVIDDALQNAIDGLPDRIATLPKGARRIPAALDFIHDAFGTTLSQAVLAVQVAARSDPVLRRRVDPIWALAPARVEELAADLFGPAIARSRDLSLLIAMVIATVRGVVTAEADDRLWVYTRRHLTATLKQAAAQARSVS